MSGCALRRWGPGTQCIKTDTPASKEMAEKLAALKAEREKLDTIWTKPLENPQSRMTETTSLRK